MNTSKALAWLSRPYIYHELPGWGVVYRKFVGGYKQDSAWAGESPRTITGKLHGFKMELDLSRWSERATYFLGRFYDLETQLLVQKVLKENDRFVDIGANIGMLSLLASRIVGGDGVVDAFEPNPACVARIRSLIQANGIKNIRIHQYALGEAKAVLPLHVPKYNSGEATLASIPSDVHDVTQFEDIEVEVVPGDDYLQTDPRPPKLIKIDVEGFECHVLKGIEGTIKAHRPVLVLEAVEEHLRRAGNSVSELIELLKSMGYQVYFLGLKGKFFAKRIALHKSTSNFMDYSNIVAIPGNSDNLKQLLADCVC